MASHNQSDTQGIIAASRAMSGSPLRSNEATFDDARERLQRVLDSIDRGLAASSASARPPVPEMATVSTIPGPSRGNPTSITAKPSSWSSASPTSSSDGSAQTAPPPPALVSSVPPSLACLTPPPPLRTEASTRGGSAITVLAREPVGNEANRAGAPAIMSSPPRGALPDASALLSRWLLQDSRADVSPIRPVPPPPPQLPSDAKGLARVGDVEGTSRLESRPTAVAPLPTGASTLFRSRNDSLFSQTAESLWSSALSTASRAVLTRGEDLLTDPVPPRAGAAAAAVRLFSDSVTARGAREAHDNTAQPSPWLPTAATPAIAAVLRETEPQSGLASSRTWMPSSLLTQFTEDSSVGLPRPRRAAPALEKSMIARGEQRDAQFSPPPRPHIVTRASVETTENNNTATVAEEERLFSILSARYGNVVGEPRREAANVPPSEAMTESEAQAGPSRHGEAPSLAARLSAQRPLNDPDAGFDGVVRSPPRASSAFASTPAHAPLREGTPSVLDVLHRRFDALLSSVSSSTHDERLGSRTTYTSLRGDTGNRVGTARLPAQLSQAHSSLLVQRTASPRADRRLRSSVVAVASESEPAAHVEATRQALMEERIRRTRDGDSPWRRTLRSCDQSQRAPSARWRSSSSPTSRTPVRAPGEDSLARYRAQREAVAAEENDYLTELLARYEEALAHNTSSDQTAALASASVAADRQRSSPLPRDAAEVQRRVQKLHRLTRGQSTNYERAQAASPTTTRPATSPRGREEPPPRSEKTGARGYSDSSDLDIPTPPHSRLHSQSPPRDAAHDIPRSKRDPTPERSAALLPLAKTAASNAQGSDGEANDDASDVASVAVDEHTQRPPPPRPSRRAPQPFQSTTERDAHLRQASPPGATAEGAEPRLYVSPTRQARRRSRGTHGKDGSGDRDSLCGSRDASSSPSLSSSSSRVSRHAEMAFRRQLDRLSGAAPKTPTRSEAAAATSTRHPVAPPGTAAMSTEAKALSAKVLPRAVIRDRARLAVIGVRESMHCLQDRGVRVRVQLGKSSVPALAQLSQDNAELLFIVQKRVTRAEISEQPQRQLPEQHKSADVEAATTYADREVSSRTFAVSASRPASSIGAVTQPSAGFVLNKFAASSRFASPMKVASGPSYSSVPLSTRPFSATPRPVAPAAVKGKKIMMRVVQDAEGRQRLVPVDPALLAHSDGTVSSPSPGGALPNQTLHMSYAPSPHRSRRSTAAPAVAQVRGQDRPSTNTITTDTPSDFSSQHTATFRGLSGAQPSHAAISVSPPRTASPQPFHAAMRTAAREGTRAGLGADSDILHIRERHHFPLRNARLLLPGHVLGYEKDNARAGPHSFEDVNGILCGPAACEVLRRYRCTLFADLAQTSVNTYRLFLVIPEFKRIDVPENAVLLVIDCATRTDWVTMLLALQGRIYGRPLLSYGRALWLLAAHRCWLAHALKGLNPFEAGRRWTAHARPPSLIAMGGGRQEGEKDRGRSRAAATATSVVLPAASSQHTQSEPRVVAARPRSLSATSNRTSASSLLYRNALPPAPQGVRHAEETSAEATAAPAAGKRRSTSVQALRRLFSRSRHSHRSVATEDDSAMTESARAR